MYRVPPARAWWLAKHRLHRADALAVQPSTLDRVDRAAHAFAGVLRILGSGLEPGYLSASFAALTLEALATQLALLAIGRLGGEHLVAQTDAGRVDAARAVQGLA